MIPKRILCPTDFSNLSKQTLRYAADFATEYDSQMTVMSVSDSFFGVDPDSSLYTSSMGTFISDLAALRDQIRNLRRVNVSSYHCLGNPATEICHHAKKEQFDLIVIGSHGRTGFKKFLLGSVTEAVIKKATTNVLVVKPLPELSANTVPHFPRGDSKKLPVVIPYDFSDGCDYAIQYACELFPDNSPIIALNIAEQHDFPNETAEQRHQRETEVFEEDRDEFMTRLNATENRRISFRTHFSKDIAGRIASYCDQVEAKMVILPSRKKSFFERMILGSTARNVAQIVPCPALIIKNLDSADSNGKDKLETDLQSTI